MAQQSRQFAYPSTRTSDVIEDYHGTPVADPYRWLEDPQDPEMGEWIEAQNKLTLDYLEGISAREMIRDRLTKLWDHPKFTAPTKKHHRYFYTLNDGLQDQPVVYMREGLEGAPVEVLNPNTFSEDGTIALINQTFNKDGTLLVYGTSSGGSDWQEIRVRSIDTGDDYPETLKWTKFSSIAWRDDSSGFYYSRFPAPDDLENPDQANFDNKVYWHALGTPQSEDVLVYERPDAREYVFYPEMTEDGGYLVLWVIHGSVNRNRVYYRKSGSDGEFTRLLDEADAWYGLIGNVGTTFYFETDLDAPRSRIIAIDLENPARENWREIIPQQDDAIGFTAMVNQQLVVAYLHNAYHQIKIYDLDGTYTRDVPLPGMGSIEGFSGKPDHTEMFIDFQSHLYPPTIFRYDFNTAERSTWQQPDLDFDVDSCETKQVFYTSKDGTRVSMFISAKKDLELNGDNPVLLYGYGGFSQAMTPKFSPATLHWLERGGVYAVANLRGGSEYGDTWHKAGMLENKQNVFDDFIAAAEWLIDNNYTDARKLAITGRSNGGLLVAACMLQRPDLYGAVVCVVPVTDMLRYHRFTAGRFWVYEYGNAEDDPEHFKFLHAYSPLHNIKQGETYPPTLITTADMDDRVVPMHAKKFAAALQAADSGANPILLRLDTRSGHGMGKPTSKWIDEWTDIHAFLMHHFEMQV